MGKIYERGKTDHENHETEQNCFRNKGTRKQIAETPKLTPMDTSTSLNLLVPQPLGMRVCFLSVFLSEYTVPFNDKTQLL